LGSFRRYTYLLIYLTTSNSPRNLFLSFLNRRLLVIYFPNSKTFSLISNIIGKYPLLKYLVYRDWVYYIYYRILALSATIRSTRVTTAGTPRAETLVVFPILPSKSLILLGKFSFFPITTSIGNIRIVKLYFELYVNVVISSS